MTDRGDHAAGQELPAALLGSFDVLGSSELHVLIRTARAGDPGATAEVLDRARRALEARLGATRGGVVVPVPGHLPGGPGPLVEALACAIAGERGWPHAADALRRDRHVPEAKAAGARDLQMERETLTWTPPLVGETIVLVDDVVRTGLTLRACAEAIRASGDDRAILMVVLAIALDHNAPGRPSRSAGFPISPQ